MGGGKGGESFNPTSEDIDAYIAANKERLDASFAEGEAAIARGDRLMTLEDVISADATAKEYFQSIDDGSIPTDVVPNNPEGFIG